VQVDPGACLAVDLSKFKPGRLVVYFHGVVERPERVEPELRALADEAVPHGFAVLALIGQKGLCNWGGDWEHWNCWPTDLSQRPDVERLAQRIQGSVAEAGRRLGGAPGPPFLTGFSNGGFFVTMLASETALDAAGYAVFHGGPVTNQSFPASRARPFLLVMARQDTIQLPKMKVLADRLKSGGWATEQFTRDGEHELRREDAKAAIAFFETQLR
jgi:predicted esterase